jgi:hypothetical protein
VEQDLAEVVRAIVDSLAPPLPRVGEGAGG